MKNISWETCFLWLINTSSVCALCLHSLPKTANHSNCIKLGVLGDRGSWQVIQVEDCWLGSLWFCVVLLSPQYSSYTLWADAAEYGQHCADPSSCCSTGDQSFGTLHWQWQWWTACRGWHVGAKYVLQHCQLYIYIHIVLLSYMVNSHLSSIIWDWVWNTSSGGDKWLQTDY
jgi:hypothetical protein